jgi:hypothetical protein
MADTFTCDECGRDFSDGKPTPGAALGLHRYREHGVRKAPAKKSPARRSRTKGQGVRLSPPRAPEPEAPPVALFDASAEPEVLPRKRRFWEDWLTRKEKTPGEIRPSKPGRPRRSHRTSFAPAGTLVWMGASQMAAGVGAMPVSRALSIQAGIAGDVLDKAVEGSRLDRMVQPFLGDTERFKDVGMLFAFPILVLVCDAQKENAMAAALLEMVVRQQLHQLAEGVRRMKAEDRKLADTVETLIGVGMDLGDNPVHTILSMIFAPVEPIPAQPSPAQSAPAAAAEAPTSPPPPSPSGQSFEWTTDNGQVPVVDPLPFAVVVTPGDVPPGL